MHGLILQVLQVHRCTAVVGGGAHTLLLFLYSWNVGATFTLSFIPSSLFFLLQFSLYTLMSGCSSCSCTNNGSITLQGPHLQHR